MKACTRGRRRDDTCDHVFAREVAEDKTYYALSRGEVKIDYTRVFVISVVCGNVPVCSVSAYIASNTSKVTRSSA